MSRLVAACRRESVDRPPVWIMRQAGRFLPEYRATRARAGSFLALCRTPELAAEVTLQPVTRFGFDAAIIFSDILLPLAPMGVEFAFPDEGGPRVERALAGPADWARLAPPVDGRGTAFVAEAIALVRAKLAPEVAMIGFCGAPWTLASYLVEGGTSRDHAAVRAAMASHPDEFRALLDVLADAMAAYLRQQVAAGAGVVQVFDSWAMALSAKSYGDVVVPALVRLLRQLDDLGVPRIVYASGGHLVPALAGLPCEAVSVDWRTDLTEAAAGLAGKAVQGNLDPAVLLAPPEAVRAATRAMLDRAPANGYVANLGHGILPATPLESVAAFLDVIRGAR
ncbi:MAG: uroporphyrinogen decarboxylase [Thermoanaerobaculaceae bacterium]|nr:uroporphyrinogen decarboxylase [Thermoanaerobaculaceae bacterium]TAM54426.1 MAG: uroporphyrinogen decarboxylase [Acidobacteriota bacterium]